MRETPLPATALPKISSGRGHLILAATIIGAGMVYLDGTVVTVALPQIQKDFKATLSGVQWLIDIYILFLTVPILVAGSLSDRYGRRKMFNIGLVGFALASAACGAAADMRLLLLARIFQGIFGAVMLPGSLAILNATFSADVRGRTVGTWAAFTSITTAIGPLLGGWLVDNVSWRAAFFINLPLALVTLFLSLRYVPESKSDAAPERQDWLGAALITVGLGGLIFGLIEGPKRGWGDLLVWGSLATSLTCLAGFVLTELKTAHPMVPFSLFKHRGFSGVTLVTFILYFAMSGVFFFFTLNLQQIQGFSATQAGAAFMPIILLLFFISRPAGAYADKFGPRLPMIVGPLVIAAGFFMYLIPGVTANYWLTFFPATVVFAAGLGITVTPLTTVAMGTIPTHLSGLASGVSNAVSRVATMLAVALLGFVMVLQFDASLTNRTRLLPLSAQDRVLLEREALNLGGASAPPHLDPATQTRIEAAIDEAFVDSFRVMMALCGGLAVLAAAVSAKTIGSRIMPLVDLPLLEPEPEMPVPVNGHGRVNGAGRAAETALPAGKGISHKVI